MKREGSTLVSPLPTFNTAWVLGASVAFCAQGAPRALVASSSARPRGSQWLLVASTVSTALGQTALRTAQASGSVRSWFSNLSVNRTAQRHTPLGTLRSCAAPAAGYLKR